MKAILLKEIRSFFGAPLGYLVIGVFLAICSIYLWIFDGDYNVLDSGFADMGPFFTLTPLVFLFLIPAVTMKSFSDEFKQGTIELLLTKPVSVWQLVLGKFTAIVFLVTVAILPSVIYYVMLFNYGLPEGSIDTGSTLGSYFGLLFVISTYAAIGLFCSSITENQIVAFVLSAITCFFLYFAFDGLASYFPDFENSVSVLGMHHHFQSMARGVIDTRDLTYFISMTVAFLSFTVFKLKSQRD